MRWSPGRILGLGAGSLGTLGGEHAAPHAGKPGRCLLLPLSPPDFPIPTARLLSRAPQIPVGAHQCWRTAQGE